PALVTLPCILSTPDPPRRTLPPGPPAPGASLTCESRTPPMTTATTPRHRSDALAYLVNALRTRRWARVGLSILSLVLLVVGVGLLAYPFATNLYQDRIQSRLDRQLASPELQQAYRERQVQTGDSLTRIQIPRIGVDVVVVEGTTASALKAGAGHYPTTPLPCEDGNVAIAGHRTTYGKPFANIDQLKPGDLITLDTPVGSCTYEVSGVPFLVLPDGK